MAGVGWISGCGVGFCGIVKCRIVGFKVGGVMIPFPTIRGRHIDVWIHGGVLRHMM